MYVRKTYVLAFSPTGQKLFWGCIRPLYDPMKSHNNSRLKVVISFNFKSSEALDLDSNQGDLGWLNRYPFTMKWASLYLKQINICWKTIRITINNFNAPFSPLQPQPDLKDTLLIIRGILQLRGTSLRPNLLVNYDYKKLRMRDARME